MKDSDFDLRQAIRSAQFANVVNIEGYRQQFDSISKDFLSSEQRNFDREIGSFHQGLSTSSLSMEQKWWSLFGKYWLVKNEKNDNDVELMRWLMTGANHGTVDTCGENVSLHCHEFYYSNKEEIGKDKWGLGG